MTESERYLRELRRGLPLPGRRRILAELRDHLEASIADALARGLGEPEAERLAIERLGPPAVLAERYAADLNAGALGRTGRVVAKLTGSPIFSSRAARLVSASAVLALLGLLAYDLADSPSGKIPSALAHSQSVKAYPFSRPLVGGNGQVSLASLRNHVVVLNFWQSYCPPCTYEAPAVSAASKEWASKGVVFVGIDVQDLSGPAAAFMKRFSIGYPVVSDDGPLIGHYGVTGYPETFFVDRRGYVVPMPPTDGQTGHIIGAATRTTLDAGIRTALAR